MFPFVEKRQENFEGTKQSRFKVRARNASKSVANRDAGVRARFALTGVDKFSSTLYLI